MSLKHNFKISTLANNLMLVQELKNKRVDAVIMEESQAKKFTEKDSKLASFAANQYGSSFAIAMPKKSEHKENIDRAIKALRNNGTIKALSKKWRIVGAE